MKSGPVAVDVARYASALGDALEASLSEWVEASVARVMTAWSGSVPATVASEARAAGRDAQASLVPQLRALLSADIDDQRTTPLALLRSGAIGYPTTVLAAAGVPEVVRDEGAEELFPDDRYDLAPASFADFGPEVADAGLAWGAAKAFEHKRRHGGTR